MYTAANPTFFPGYPQSQAPATSGMNASQTQTPDHSQLGMPAAPSVMVNNFPQDYTLGKQKRKQVRNACINCQKACKKCDEQRPCPRCVKYGTTDTCVNSVRKERKKGVKRGPYKKRKQGGATSGDSSASSTPNMSVPQMPNGMYSSAPTTGAAIAAATNGANAPINYQPYGNAAQFQSFPNFQGNAQYLPYNILNNMNNIIQQAAANAANNGNASKDSQQQEGGSAGSGTENKSSTETDENGKLSILSQLCTAVLDRAPNGGESSSTDNKETNSDDKNNINAQAESTEGTDNIKTIPTQSTTHSRESTKNGSATDTTTEPVASAENEVKVEDNANASATTDADNE
ncbi:hypothetical protein BC941DRAFT_448100 [Chlamydoabsidia padenii]|nr:hypothetical protein BC941DRAFT_448100 [Chlamydoabsidia padenii]